MANAISKAMTEKYLDELLTDEKAINEAGEAFVAAKARVEVTLRRYMALRDFVTELLGRSPYSIKEWPGDSEEWGWQTRGNYRFTGMPVGKAVEMAIRERSPRYGLTLDDLVATLAEGGLGFPDGVQARAVNAALLKLPDGIHKGKLRNGDTCYYWEPFDDPVVRGDPADPEPPYEDESSDADGIWYIDEEEVGDPEAA